MTDRESAPLKINLFLHVVGRRPDGYHLLQSLFVFADVGEYICYTPSNEPLRLTVTGRFSDQLATSDDNLVMRAARLLSSAPTGELTLHKQSPIAAGLGGGSADAAATLRLLNRQWHLGLDFDALRHRAARLGADVPACIESIPVLAEGIGDVVTPISSTYAAPMLLINPGIAVATPQVFSAYRDSCVPFTLTLREPLIGGLDWTQCHNDLAAPAISLAPEINTVLETLRGLEGVQQARMSGSGASCFAVFESQPALDQAKAIVSALQPGWWSQAVLAQLPTPHFSPNSSAIQTAHHKN